MEKGEATVPILKARFSGRARWFQPDKCQESGTAQGHQGRPPDPALGD